MAWYSRDKICAMHMCEPGKSLCSPGTRCGTSLSNYSLCYSLPNVPGCLDDPQLQPYSCLPS